jgi:hypothetical protein
LTKTIFQADYLILFYLKMFRRLVLLNKDKEIVCLNKFLVKNSLIKMLFLSRASQFIEHPAPLNFVFSSESCVVFFFIRNSFFKTKIVYSTEQKAKSQR